MTFGDDRIGGCVRDGRGELFGMGMLCLDFE